ncbi:DUF1665 domain-containing protein [Cordyceps fumosorosea ARSEF 2679]|uniref:DUF1665 domain-containing protein n=1 Tax=Cordyceps fumosorosea (strain ARSEF 2679) TaxID=1081104 RepID=A0A162LM08_CORFA|nr:DUF1665 domain-containing protein [Cordyceps fumosorosea ARSEF 2679]OAA72604.1 DUF1665 domain-containing protein [Cordyceps fumosorosea ARSEF 2679]
MAGPFNKKRPMGGKFQKPMKRQKRERRVQKEYHSSTEDEEGGDDQQQNFDAVNLLDSDDDIHNAKADDVGEDDRGDASSSEDEAPPKKASGAKGSAKLKAKMPKTLATDDKSDVEEGLPEPADNDDDDDDDEDEDLNDEFDLGEDDDDDDEQGGSRKPKKRNDPAAFATSLSKILSTKLSSSKRADPVLARSAAAHETSRAMLESALEAKAKRQLREQKRKAQEKGRVRDVLVAPEAEARSSSSAPVMTTADILATEARLRKVAQRGVVKMFNAVRAAQVKSSEAERATRQAGVIGMGRREEKVNEMSKKGFLDLLASGGNALRKGASAIEEA